MFLRFGGCPALGHRGMTGTYPPTRSGSTRAAGPHQRGHAARERSCGGCGRPQPKLDGKNAEGRREPEPEAGVSPLVVVVKVGATAQDENPSPPGAQTPGQAMTNHATTDPTTEIWQVVTGALLCLPHGEAEVL